MTPGADWGMPHDPETDPWPAVRPGAASIWLFDLDAPAIQAPPRLAVLSDGEHDRARRFVFEYDRRRWLAAHVTLRWLLARTTHRAPRELVFAASADGKPGFADPDLAARWAFNLSHSGRWGLVGVSRAGAIGVDIETHRPMPDAAAIAKTHFSTSEQAEFEALSGAERSAAFFACWTRKEAYVKAVGTGLATPLDRFDVTLRPGDSASIRSIDGSTDAARRWTLVDLDSGSGTTSALAIECPAVDVRRRRCAFGEGAGRPGGGCEPAEN